MGLNMLRVLQAFSLVVLSLVLCSGCGSNASLESSTSDGSTITTAELKHQLNMEFKRLGIDPTKVAGAAPSGESNAVFDLDAYLYELNPGSGDPPAGIELAWTERAVGDYDMNGEVNVADLTPLGVDFLDTVDYEPAADHGGIAWFPEGDPDDDGGVGEGQPPTADSGAANWRLARTDGDGNGELNVADLTPIAVHWQERLDGYRIYRKGPQDTNFNWLPNPDEPSADVTVYRSDMFPDGSNSADNKRPLRYFFEDLVTDAGTYTYYVAPFDGNDNSEGTASSQVAFAFPGGGNQAPVVVLTSVPANGDVPFSMTWDASGSYDIDGTVAKFEWDMDQDPQTFEWDSGTDPLLPMTYNTPGKHIMTVRVTDNDGRSNVGQGTTIATQAGNFPPVAVLSANPPNAQTGDSVTWDASASSDQDGTIVKYEWDMDGDPLTYEWDSGTDPTLQKTYYTPATHSQWVRVTDDSGLTDTIWGTCVVTAGANQTPTAVLAANPSLGPSPLSVTWDASASFDADGTIVLYEWDTGNDGTYEYDTGTTPTTSFVYHTHGDYGTTVRVTDNLGATATATDTVSVTGIWHTYTIDSTGDTGMGPSLVKGLGNVAPAIAYYKQVDPTTMALRFIHAKFWDGADWHAPVTIISGPDIGYNPSLYWMETQQYAGITTTDLANAKTYFFAAVSDFTSWQGPYEVHALGYLHSALLEVQGLPAAFYCDNASNRAFFEPTVDFTGSDWSGTSYSVNGAGTAGSFELSAAIVNGKPALAYSDLSAGAVNYCQANNVGGTGWGVEIPVGAGAGVGFGISMAVIGGRPAISFTDWSTGTIQFCRANDADGAAPWSSVQTAATYTLGNLPALTQLVESKGKPVIIYSDFALGLVAVYGEAVDGTVWSMPQSIDPAATESAGISATTNAGVDATILIAYSEANAMDLKFAILY